MLDVNRSHRSFSRGAPWALLALAALLVGACGGGGGSGYSSAPAAPSGPSAPAAPAAPAGPTITITSSGVSPKELNVPLGAQVMFVNQDGRSHEVMSDPHPIHSDCSEVNQVAMLGPGQSRMTGALNAAKVCGFHDNLRDGDTSLRGKIIVAGAEDPGTRY